MKPPPKKKQDWHWPLISALRKQSQADIHLVYTGQPGLHSKLQDNTETPTPQKERKKNQTKLSTTGTI